MSWGFLDDQQLDWGYKIIQTKPVTQIIVDPTVIMCIVIVHSQTLHKVITTHSGGKHVDMFIHKVKNILLNKDIYTVHNGVIIHDDPPRRIIPPIVFLVNNPDHKSPIRGLQLGLPRSHKAITCNNYTYKPFDSYSML